jgi:hypothetical protein
VSEVLAASSQSGDSAAIDLGQGDVIVLNGVAKSALTAGDFLFV